MDTPFRLRPMDLRDILDDTFDLYKENFVFFVTITALVFLPFNLILSLFQGGGTPTFDPADISGFASFFILQFVTIFLGAIATYVAMGALTQAVSERYLGRRITVRESYAAIMDRFWPFILTLLLPFFAIGFISVVAIALGVGIVAGMAFLNPILGVIVGIVVFIAVIVLLIYLWFAISFVIPVFIVEGLSGAAAVRRSFQLFWFSSGKAISTLLLVTIIVWVVMAVVIGPFAGLLGVMGQGGGVAGSLFMGIYGAVSGIVQSVVQPIQIIVILLLYYDIRIRREGYDLEMMANDLRSSVAAGPAPPADVEAGPYPE